MENWMGNIFISYAREDFNQYVLSVMNMLDIYHIDYWVDIDRVNTGDFFLKEIEEKILKTNKFIVFISNTYITKRWCMHELDLILENNNDNRIVMPIICGEDSISNIQNLPFINNYAFEKLNSVYDSNDIQNIVHRFIKALMNKNKKNVLFDYTVFINRLNSKLVFNKEVIIYFIHLLAENKNSKEKIIIASNITDLILSDVMQKHDYHDKVSSFTTTDRFPKEILVCLAIINNSKLLIMNDNNLSRLLNDNCIYALSILLEWYIS